MIETYSVNLLKKIKNKTIDKVELTPENSKTDFGNNFHALISYYLKGFEIKKLEGALKSFELEKWKEFKNSSFLKEIVNADEKFIEQPFLIKELLKNAEKPFYLTGRFDAVIRLGQNYTVLDWKTGHLPKNPDRAIQTVVYLHAAHKLFNTKNVKMKYYSIEEKTFYNASFNPFLFDEIVSKILS